MSNKVDRALHGPGWGEVILGALLSLLLGGVLAAASLVAKPVAQVKELPKEEERKADVVYYVEGTRDSSKSRQALAKRKAFVEGQSVTVNEDEINALVPAARAAASTPAAKKDDKAGADGPEMFAVGTANFRIRDGVIQIGAPVTLNAMGFSHRLIVQGRGGLEKRGDIFAFDPDEIYIGSCPVHRLPLIGGYVERKFLEAQTIPEDVATAWKNLADATVEGSEVKLTAR